MAFRIEIDGLDELRKKLHPQAFRQFMLNNLPAAFEPAKTAVQAAAPRGKTGRLASKKMVIRVRSQRGGFTVTISSRAGYGHMVDKGHRIIVGARRATEESRAVRGFDVGFVPGKNFVEPAYRSAETQVVANIEQRIEAWWMDDPGARSPWAARAP